MEDHFHTFTLSSAFIHFHPGGLPWSVSDRHRMVLNAQTDKWMGWEGWKSLNASLLRAPLRSANNSKHMNKFEDEWQHCRQDMSISRQPAPWQLDL